MTDRLQHNLDIGFVGGVVRQRPPASCCGRFGKVRFEYRVWLRLVPARIKPWLGICPDFMNDACALCWKRGVREIEIAHGKQPAITALAAGEIDWQELEDFMKKITEDPRNGYF